MKKSMFLVLLIGVISAQVYAQTDRDAVERVCMNYIEGFYEGDQDKLRECLQPELNKFGFWKNDEGNFSDPIRMSYEAALEYAKNVEEKKEFPDPSAPKNVNVLDVKEFIAVAKVTAWWGEDYILLSRRSGKWMIEQVIWQGPYSEN